MTTHTLSALRLLKLVLLTSILIVGFAASSLAVVEEQVRFDNSKTEKRYKQLIAELRCLVCQNQNLADSDAELAKDLRRKTVEMLKSGASNDDVRTYMSDRYGDFVLYKPPFNRTTAFIWLGPFILLFAVLIGAFFNIRKRQQNELVKPAHANSNHQARVKVRNLLKDTPSLDVQTPDKNKPNSNDKNI